MDVNDIPVRYEKHDGGGSVWALIDGEYWLCVYCTIPKGVGRQVRTAGSIRSLMAYSTAGPSIPVPDWD